jgi:anti-sigma regulatory factor (Ser/Thr protein kinase)
MCHQASTRLAGTPLSVSASRTFVTNQLAAWGVTPHDNAHDRVADITLVTSELAANATKFGSQDIEISLVAHGDHVEISVTDDNPQPARLQQPGPDAPGGRGLLLVDALAERWGQRHQDNGKTVWAHLALPTGSILGHGCKLTPLERPRPCPPP